MALCHVIDGRVGGGRLDGLDAILGAGLGLIPLAGGDNLAVRGFAVEPELAGLVLADFELSLIPSMNCLIVGVLE